MRHHTPEFEAPAMHETQLLIHLREQVSRKTRHILGNLVEAEHDPSKIRSSLLRVYEKKLGTYYQEYAKLHQEILDRIPASEFKEQEELQMDFDRLHIEALLRIEKLSASLAGEYQLSESEVRVLESFQSRQRSESVREKLSGQSNVKPLNHVATTGSNVESAQEERSNRPSVTPTNHTVIPIQPSAKSQPKECRPFGGFHNRHQEKSVSEELYDSSSLEPPAKSETSKDQPNIVHREYDRSSCTKEPRHTTRCGLPSTKDRQGVDWKRTSLRTGLTPTKQSSQSCMPLSSGTAIPVQEIQPVSEDWGPSGRTPWIHHQSQCGCKKLFSAPRIERPTRRVRSDHQLKNAQKEHCKPVSVRNHRQSESARVEHSDPPSYTMRSDESAAPGLLHEVDHRHRPEPAQKKNSNQPRVESYANVHSTTLVDHPESIRKEHSKPTSIEQQLRHVESSIRTVTVAAVKCPELAQEKHSGPSSVEQPVHTATFVEGSAFTPRMQANPSVKELMNLQTRTTESTTSTRGSESAQEELSDLSCVQQTVHTATSAVEPESAYKQHFKPCSDDLPDFTADSPNHVKNAQDEQFWLSYVKPFRGAIAADRKTILDKSSMLLDGKPSFATVINQMESTQVEPSKPSTCVKTLVNPAVFSKGSELETMKCGTITVDNVKLAPNTAARVAIYDTNSEKENSRDLPRLKAMKKWHTKPAKPPPMKLLSDPRLTQEAQFGSI
ncbi:uncharacterized protein LOC134287062 [Aedes albopictus]|uniref:Uncharacterized protein n=1 Tax=Aedes albopictus TaxID=7160 RepID=A0ABM1XQ14_AEDAL